MNLPMLLVQDGSTFFGFFGNLINSAFGGDMIFLGLLMLFFIAYILLQNNVKGSGAVAIGVCIVFTISLLNPMFSFMFYVALVVVALMLVNGLRKMVTGQ